MNHGWSPADKAIAKNAAEKARRRAEQEAIQMFHEYKISKIDDLWALELIIRQWRRERQHCFTLNFQTVDAQLAAWLSKRWLHESDLTRMSPERLNAIKARTSHAAQG